ncbi:hypothetical protein [Mucilaginibacter sp. PAMB04168]|uniref:hypothetical protein n=1 Tax=Mucilaginibacter sp. PAMB04168 TaxID=3138567 RepID=UPI0031F6283A
MSKFLNAKFSYKVLVLIVGLLLTGMIGNSFAQDSKSSTYWNVRLNINALRLPPPPANYKPALVDLDHDGDPDVIRSVTRDSIGVMWVDDNDDMKWGDLEGDTYSDCLLIDRNRDGRYGAMGDLIIDWVDNDNDKKADMQVIADYPLVKNDNPWPYGHYMWVMDIDKDNIFNYIDWNNFEIKAWDKNGISDFMLDYSGNTEFMKIHVATYTLNNLKMNWENPFIFYDPDNDGLSEMAVRLVDSPKNSKPGQDTYQTKLSGNIDWMSIGIDMDNDNAPGNDFDYDLSISFRGGLLDYRDQIHSFKNMRGLPEADQFFMDPRWRQLTELVYPDRDHALDLVFNRGKWKQAVLVYDEDDDCNRWERVEFYDPSDPFKVGTGKGGLDNNGQADPAGDRGEWDKDFSGSGKLYLSKFDGRIHLYGAEWGCWRIDQNATFYQGWDRKWLAKDPSKFATVKYVDDDQNGFLDKILYDLDGDKVFEDSVELKKLDIKDDCELIDISKFKYQDYTALHKRMADQLWANAQLAVKAAQSLGLNLSWYAKLMQVRSEKDRYTNGYWLQFYLYQDIKNYYMQKNDLGKLVQLKKAYYGSNWKLLIK